MKKAGGGGGKGHTSKHAGTRKHHARTSKHHPAHHHLTAEGRQDLQQAGAHTKGKHPHHARGLAVGDLLPACTLEAVAMSLRLAGQPVGDDEVAWLWELCGSRELSIAEALEAAARYGLGGPCVVGRYSPVEQAALRHVLNLPQRHLLRHAFGYQGGYDAGRAERSFLPAPGEVNDVLVGDIRPLHALILGVDRPGPHAVLATAVGWWSWGELWTPWTTAVSEAWVITWQ